MRKQDLDIDLVIGTIDARRVIDRIGVDQAASERVFDTATLGDPKITTFANSPGTQLSAVDSNRIVIFIGNIDISFIGCLDIGADSTIPQQVNLCL